MEILGCCLAVSMSTLHTVRQGPSEVSLSFADDDDVVIMNFYSSAAVDVKEPGLIYGVKRGY